MNDLGNMHPQFEPPREPRENPSIVLHRRKCPSRQMKLNLFISFLALLKLLGLIVQLRDERLPSTLHHAPPDLYLLNLSRASCLFFIIGPFLGTIFLISAFRLASDSGSIFLAQYQFHLKLFWPKPILAKYD